MIKILIEPRHTLGWAGEYEILQQLEHDYSDLLETEVCL